MCDSHTGFETFRPMIIGGVTGDYSIECPTVSCQYAEFAICGVSSGGPTNYLISGANKPGAQLDYTGVKSLTDMVWQDGIAISTSAASLSFPWDSLGYYRVTNSQKRVFVRIDTSLGTNGYIIISFRIMPLTVIPGPSPTVHPNDQALLNQARHAVTNMRLGKMGIPVRANQNIEGESDGRELTISTRI